jgi:serine/threonine protein kinase
MVRQDEPRKPKEFQLSVNELFQDAVLKLIAKQPDDRYQTPADLLRELQRIGKYNNLEADWSQWVD